jgi:hypothetical protein
MTTPATPPPPAPVPPELLRPLFAILSRWGRVSFALKSKYSGIDGDMRDLKSALESFLATRAPLPAEPTSSDSSGDAHLRDALDEIERLKSRPVPPISCEESHELQSVLRTLTNSGTALITSARELVRLWEEGKAALAAERTKIATYSEVLADYRAKLAESQTKLESAHAKALAQEGENKRLREGISTATDLVKNLIHSEGCGFVLGMDENEKYCVVSPCTCGKQAAFDVLSAALATPSPAPVAGKTNPPEISSPLVDGGEKDSAGPTLVDLDYDGHHNCATIEAIASIEDRYRPLMKLALIYEATIVATKRKLTASDSLRREAEESLTNVVNNCIGEIWASITVFDAAAKLPQHEACKLRAKGLRDFIRSLTPPVAGETLDIAAITGVRVLDFSSSI